MNEYQSPQPYQEPQQGPIVIIDNIIKASVCVLLIAVCFVLVIMVTSTIDNQGAVQFSNYTDDFAISNPLMNQVVYTSNPHLDNIVVTKHNSSNGTFGGVPTGDWSFDDDTTALEITTGLEHTIDFVRIDATTTYSTPPTLSVFTTIAIALIIMSLASIFGIVGYSQYRKRQNQYPYR